MFFQIFLPSAILLWMSDVDHCSALQGKKSSGSSTPVPVQSVQYIIQGVNEHTVSNKSAGTNDGDGLLDIWDKDTRSSIRVEAEIVQLTNDEGILADGSRCDIFRNPCDPACYADFDLLAPTAAFPGGTTKFTKLKQLNDYNSPVLDATIDRTFCSKLYKEASLRVYCEDVDAASDVDLINRWNCPINRPLKSNEKFAEWTQPADCLPQFQAGRMRLTYRYKIYYTRDREVNCRATARDEV
ncbi:hypothetical protein RvY_10576 [Ramazzottius varieornatus]|uniref:Uncharacterized protein n=1 Tax=Ramazzottius varieornatus TaxID=947166 RepID=A0A1D1VL10_RAMVA|nr:hypothetical protein RvY_10576 [Ramazzottius varieornatus]